MKPKKVSPGPRKGHRWKRAFLLGQSKWLFRPRATQQAPPLTWSGHSEVVAAAPLAGRAAGLRQRAGLPAEGLGGPGTGGPMALGQRLRAGGGQEGQREAHSDMHGDVSTRTLAWESDGEGRFWDSTRTLTPGWEVTARLRGQGQRPHLLPATPASAWAQPWTVCLKLGVFLDDSRTPRASRTGPHAPAAPGGVHANLGCECTLGCLWDTQVVPDLKPH